MPYLANIRKCSMAASIAIRIAYGYKVDSADDLFVQHAEEAMAAFSDGENALLHKQRH